MEPRTLRQWAGANAPAPIRTDETALLLVDYQREYLDGELALPGARATIARARQLMSWADATGIPVIHVHHVSARADAPLFAPGTRAVEPIPGLAPAPGHRRVVKTMPSAFHDTGLDAALRERGLRTVVVAGFMTHMCVDTTSRDAVHRGYRVIVVGDACASRALAGGLDEGLLHRASLAALADRFADVVELSALEGLATAAPEHAS